MVIKTTDNAMTIAVGSPSFLFSFYSTIICTVPDHSKYSATLQFLQRGKLQADRCSISASELEQLRAEMQLLPPDQVVWDMNDRSKQPPWKNNISSHITSLGNYFVTSDGRDLFDELIALMQHASLHSSDVIISE